MEEIKIIKDDAVNLGATEDQVCSEIDPENKERTLEEGRELQKRKKNKSTVKEENIALVTDENYVSRSEATELTKQFFRNNLEDSDCRTFITTRGEVITSNSNIYYCVTIFDLLGELVQNEHAPISCVLPQL